jgi:hypothetical protein
MNHLSVSCTVEDVLTFNKKDIQEYLRSNQQKVSGTKLELATKTCNHVKLVQGYYLLLKILLKPKKRIRSTQQLCIYVHWY